MKNSKLETAVIMAMVKYRAYENREIEDARIVFRYVDKAKKIMHRLDIDDQLSVNDRHQAEDLLRDCEIETAKLCLAINTIES